MKFTEAQLEQVFADLLVQEGYPHHLGNTIARPSNEEVLIAADLRAFLHSQYHHQGITEEEITGIINKIKHLPANDLYDTNRTLMRWLSDGFELNRINPAEKDIYIQLIDYSGLHQQRQSQTLDQVHIAEPDVHYGKDNNIYKFVTQLDIFGTEKRIPDGILYVNGLPVVVFEFKSAIREEATIFDAHRQLTVRYRRDIPELFKYNAFCVISDGVNSKAGSFFADYEFFYAWRRVAGLAKDRNGIDSMFTLLQGMLRQNALRDLIRNFIYLPDTPKNEDKIVCRYPQYYAARALYNSIQAAQRPRGNGKGGTYFGATGSGKSYTMLFLTRLVMKSLHFESPTIVLITDRSDLDLQLTKKFTNAKKYIGDNTVLQVSSRADLHDQLQGRASGGVFLTTIHKFTEDTRLLTKRSNVICISDEAHRSQVNLDQKIQVTKTGVKKTYGFAKYLHDSLPNATYVGFTGTPIDATMDVFGEVVDAYTMTESVRDEITVSIVYEGRAAKIALQNSELVKIEQYYEDAVKAGANEYQIEKSKTTAASMTAIVGDPDRLKEVADDFVQHYENRINEGASVKGKAMFVCYNREIAYAFYQNLMALRPKWAIAQVAEEGAVLTDKEKKEIKPMEWVKMVMTRGKDDPKELYDLLGTKEYRSELDRQFKNEKSNFKIAIVVDMWLTGFDVPFLDTIYIDKPIRQHNLIQTISRVNRTFKGKNKGLVVDYIGIKNQMNQALAKYNKGAKKNFEGVEQSLVVVRDHLDLLTNIFHHFDSTLYFSGTGLQQLHTLNQAAEYVQQTQELERRFMDLVKRLKAAYDICTGSGSITQTERDQVHFYLAVRSIVFKLTKGGAPDTAQMNKKVREMIKNALQSEGVAEIFKLGTDNDAAQDIFDEAYLERINKIKLPNTKIKLLQQLLAQAIGALKLVNKVRGVDFSKKMKALVEKYNDRSENDIFRSEVYEEMTEQLTNLIWDIQQEFSAGDELGIDFEEKAFYDILKNLCVKYDFTYPEDKLIILAKAIKVLVDEQAKFPDWNKRETIRETLKMELIVLLDKYGYPTEEDDEDEVYKEIFEQAGKEIFEQAENFKKNKL